MLYTKVVVINAIYNFVVDKFVIWSHLEWNIHFMFIDFRIQNLEFSTWSTKVD